MNPEIERGRLITLFQGKESEIPLLEIGQPAYTTDTRRIWVGTVTGNRRVVMEGEGVESTIADNSIGIEKLKPDLQTLINNFITLNDIPLVSHTKDGLMLKEDKIKLDNISQNSLINVIDNLTSTSTTDALSAKQGKELKDLIDDIVNMNITVINNLTSTSATDALSANMGRELRMLIDGKATNTLVTHTENGLMSFVDKIKLDGIEDGANKTIVVDDLVTESSTSALSARQGKILKDLIDNGAGGSSIDVINELTSTSEDDALSANMGRVLDEKITTLTDRKATTTSLGNVIVDGTTINVDENGIISVIGGTGGSTNVVDNLISTSITDALSANQGRVLNDKITTHTSATVVSTDGAHEIRWFGDKLQVKVNGVWIDASSGGGGTPTTGNIIIYRDAYNAGVGQTLFDITLTDYITTLPTLVFKNSILLPPSDYQIVENLGTYSVIVNSIKTDDLVDIVIWTNSTGSVNNFLTLYREEVIVTNSETSFPIGIYDYTPDIPTLVSKNSVVLPESDYTIELVNGQYEVEISNAKNDDLIQILVWTGGGTGTGGGASIKVINSLTSTSRTSALSANMGRVLKNMIDDKASKDLATTTTRGLMSPEDKRKLNELAKFDVINNLNSTSTTDALSANQGRVLKSLIENATYELVTTTTNGLMRASDKRKLDGIDDGATKTTIVDNLNSFSSLSALSANQGRILKGLIDAGGSGGTVDVIDNLNSYSSSSALSANQGRVLKNMINDVDIDVINNLTSTSTTDALSANQGRLLNNTTVKLSGGTMQGQLIAQSNNAYVARQVRNTFIALSEPTPADGQNGDLWVVYQ